MNSPKTPDLRGTELALAVLFAGVLMVGALFDDDAGAQGFGEAVKGFSAESDDPIQIEADRLEIRDKEKIAIYAGNVRVRQGETVLKTVQLRVYYTGEAAGVTPGSNVSRIEAIKRVVVQSGSQTATGDNAVFEMAADRITMTGNVVLTEGKNIVRGNKLVVDLKSRKARMEGNRVQTILTPSRVQNKN